MAISKKILNYLASKKYRYSVIDHKTTFTAWDTAQTEKVDPKTVAKALVLKADKQAILALLPSNRKLDAGKLLKILNAQRKKAGLASVSKISFAKEVWMKKNIPGKVGATPPFREILGLEIIVDKLLLKSKKIYVGTGEYTQSFLLSSAQFLKAEKPVLGNFSLKK